MRTSPSFFSSKNERGNDDQGGELPFLNSQSPEDLSDSPPRIARLPPPTFSAEKSGNLRLSFLLSSIYIFSSVVYLISVRVLFSTKKFQGAILVLLIDSMKMMVCVVAYRIQYKESILIPLFFTKGTSHPSSIDRFADGKMVSGRHSTISEDVPSSSSSTASTGTLSSKKLWRCSVPFLITAGLYTVYNNLTVVCLRRMNASTYQVFLQSKILITGVLFTIFFKRRFSLRQWMSIVILTVGVMVKFIPVSSSSEPSDEGSGSPSTSSFVQSFLNLILVLFQASLSSVAGVYTEFALKQQAQLSIHIQNFFMYFFSLLIGVIIVVFTLPSGSSFSFFDFFDIRLIVVACFGVSTGLSASFLLKYINVIVKGFAAAVEVIVTAFVSSAVLGDVLTKADFFAALFVSYAIYLHSSKGWGDSTQIRTS